jgi:hypothetical protein
VNTEFKKFPIMVFAIKILSKIAGEGGFETKFGDGYGGIGSGTSSAADKT